jgi:hypothetical protein
MSLINRKPATPRGAGGLARWLSGRPAPRRGAKTSIR